MNILGITDEDIELAARERRIHLEQIEAAREYLADGAGTLPLDLWTAAVGTLNNHVAALEDLTRRGL